MQTGDKCRFRRNIPLKACTPLAVAGAGSLTLNLALEKAIGKIQPHDHNLRMEGQHSSCYILTLRDPASRFESGWRSGQLHQDHGLDSVDFGTVKGGTNPVRSMSDWVMIFQKASHPGFASAMRNYWTSVAHPISFTRGLGIKALGRLGGSDFLVSQLDFFRGLNCSRMEVHVICLENFDQEWPLLLQRFGNNRTHAPHSNHRSNVSAWLSAPRTSDITKLDDLTLHKIWDSYNTKLSPDAADFLRNCLYPWDNILYNRICHMPTP